MAGLSLAAPLILPLLIAVFLTILTAPVVLEMERRGVVPALAVTSAMVALVAAIFVFGALLTTSMRGLNEALPRYQGALADYWDAAHELSQRLPFDVTRGAAFDQLDPQTVIDTVSSVVTTTLAALSNTALVLITVVFMLLEVAGLPRKLRLAMDDPKANLGAWAGAVREVQRYLAIKTAVSAITGTLVALWLWVLGVDFPILWGLVAFALNYVPNVGSIIAAIPAIIIATVQPGLGPGTGVAVAFGYLVVNMVLGNMLEPQWMGRSFRLSPLVVFLSLVFWGFVWGPVGMLLSVPLTMIVRIVAEQLDETHWLVVLLGPAPVPPPAQTPKLPPSRSGDDPPPPDAGAAGPGPVGGPSQTPASPPDGV